MFNIIKTDNNGIEANIISSCGHSHIKRGPDTQENRDSWEAEGSKLCYECNIFLQKNGILPLEAEKLVELQGSEKQIEWALKIRMAFLKSWDVDFPAYKRRGASVEDLAKIRQVLVKLANDLPQSKWWIDNRGNERKALTPAYQAEMSKLNN